MKSSSVSDLGKEWGHGVGGNITLGYTKILTESDKTKKEILDKLIKLAEQRGYERGKRDKY